MKNRSSWILISLLFFSLLFFYYAKTHLCDIYALNANYHFKKNNFIKAQELYEKAFILGLERGKEREIYINMLINSPLTIENQEKIISFLNLPKEDSAKLRGEHFINNLRQEILRKYPENYIENTVFNQKIMRWADSPITYSFYNTENIPKYFIKEIENAFSEWEIATKQEIKFFESSKNPNIVIKFEQKNPAKNKKEKYIVAYTVPIVNIDNLDKMEIIFYLKNPSGKDFSANQVYNTALHEIAHALGFMGHSDNAEHLMYLSKNTESHNKNKREQISPADINTIQLLYKIKPQITNNRKTSGKYIPNLILGSQKDILNEKIKEAENYIEKAPNLASGYIDLAEAYVAEKDYENAIKNLEKSYRLADSEEIKGMILYNLAITNFYIDNFEKALIYLDKSIQIRNSEEKHYLLAEIKVRENKIEEAIKEYEYLITQDPKNIEYVISLTNIYILNRDFIKARKVLKNYIKNNPSEKNNSRFDSYGILKIFL